MDIFSARAAAALAVLLLLAGCASPDSPPVVGALALSEERPHEEALRLAKTHYAAGDYGLAERHFRQAVESNSASAEAWLGLAAAYDRLARFDLAEQAYERTLALAGRSPEVLNNLGYHHLLRGNLGKARAYLMEAARKDPGNSLIQGNLQLLEVWKAGS